ncbi:hypothetical protein GGU11DRAFT_772772 [Lentinula aff. detonsa]|nr:hypothetical protein GGU11DRAFT_772772 [Lentinula aff. detonsa]
MTKDGVALTDDLSGSNSKSNFQSQMKRKLVAGDVEASSVNVHSTSSAQVESRYSKRIKLHIDIPTSSGTTMDTSLTSTCTRQDDTSSETFSSLSPDSLFDEVEVLSFLPPTSPQPPLQQNEKAALRTAPPIPGLFFDPSVRLSEELAEELADYCMDRYFDVDEGRGRINQIMLFERAASGNDIHDTCPEMPISTGLPLPLRALLNKLSDLLRPPAYPSDIHELLFPSLTSSKPAKPISTSSTTHHEKPKQARQAILNLYDPGEGISSHVDLLRRFGDGIIGVSLRGGCVMRFERVLEEEYEALSKINSYTSHASSSSAEYTIPSAADAYELYLPPNSIIVLSGDARYKWTHGIGRRVGDWVVSNGDGDTERVIPTKAEWIPRRTRLSITFRWLLPGADVVGQDELGSES